MERLRLYKIEDKYIRFLHGADFRVQYNKQERRPYIGVVLTIGEYNYFVPMESPKPNHDKVKSGIHIMRLAGGHYGLLGFNNMIPVQEENLIAVDIAQEPDAKYRELLINQLVFCNKHRNTIREHALKTYEAVTEKKTEFYTRICCDFKKLEKASSHYDPNYIPKKRK